MAIAAREIESLKRDIEELKLQMAFLISRYVEEEEVSEEEKMEIEWILEEVRKGKYITKDEFKREVLEE